MARYKKRRRDSRSGTQNGRVTLKDLALGAEMSKAVENRAEWIKDRVAQVSVPRAQLVEKVRAMLHVKGG